MAARVKTMCLYFFLNLFFLLSLYGCGYYEYYAKPLWPASDTEQSAGMHVSDDGSVTFTKERLEISVRPITDEELNRQFASVSEGGVKSTNPYTYGDWKDGETSRTPQRFTVFKVKIKNYAYPKVYVDPMKAVLIAGNSRTYRPLSLGELEAYYFPYAVGHAGNTYRQYEERKDIMKKTQLTDDMIFSGQEHEGFIVFPRLHHDVKRIRFLLEDVALRFDFRGEPIETADVTYLFQRDAGRVYVRQERFSSGTSSRR